MSDEIKKTDDLKKSSKAKNTKATESRSNTKDSKKNAKKSGKTPKSNPFLKIWKAIVRFFKNTKGEIKKIIWPGRQMVIKSTGVVIASILIIGAGVWILDYALSGGLGLIKKASDKQETTTTTAVTETTTDTTATSSDTTESSTDATTEATTESTTVK